MKFKVGDRVRHLRLQSASGAPRVPSKAVGDIVRIKGDWVWIRFSNHNGQFDRMVMTKHTVLADEIETKPDHA